MIRLHETRHVDRSPADCFRYLADFSTCEQWDPAVSRAVKLTPGTPAVGSEFDITVRVAARKSTMRYVITGLDDGQRIDLRGRGAGVSTEETITLAADGDGTRIDYRADFSLRGMLGAASALAAPLLARMGKKAVDGLADALAIKSQPPRQGWMSYAADRSVIAAAPGFTERGYLAMGDKSHSEFMDDAVVAVTGATGGIGQAIACEYARLGATVLIIGRGTQKLAAAVKAVRDFSGADADQVKSYAVDFLALDQIQAAAAAIRSDFPKIDVLVNNAGAMFDTHDTTADGFERTLAVNLVAPFVLTEGLMTSLLAGSARVINMSSGGMYLQPLVLDDMNYTDSTYSATKAYARAKRGLVALNRHWSRRYGDAGVHFNAMHPGWAATPGVTDALPGFDKLMHRVLRDARMAADTAVWLGSAHAAADLNGGFYLDRTPHPTAVIPGTDVKPSEAQSLYAWLRNETGIDLHELR